MDGQQISYELLYNKSLRTTEGVGVIQESWNEEGPKCSFAFPWRLWKEPRPINTEAILDTSSFELATK